MKSKIEIQEILRAHLEELRADYAIAEIGFFGSYSRGEQSPQSDLDVLVQFSKPTGFVKFLELEQYLQHLLAVKVDLVTPSALKPHIGSKILEEVQYVH